MISPWWVVVVVVEALATHASLYWARLYWTTQRGTSGLWRGKEVFTIQAVVWTNQQAITSSSPMNPSGTRSLGGHETSSVFRSPTDTLEDNFEHIIGGMAESLRRWTKHVYVPLGAIIYGAIQLVQAFENALID